MDYYPFGMVMPGKKYGAASRYRYGFNGKEEDDEVKGDGNEQDYGMRIYDTRLGRFLSVDPLSEDYPELTPYQFASNRPVDGADLDGEEWELKTPVNLIKQQTAQIQLPTANPWCPTCPSVYFAPIEQHIMMSNGLGTTYIGPKSVVQSNIAISRQNYNNAVAENIANGPFGAADYLIDPSGGGFRGAAIDGIVMSFGGIPAGESSVFPKARVVEPSMATNKQATAANGGNTNAAANNTNTARYGETEPSAATSQGNTNTSKSSTSGKLRGVNNPKVKEALDYGNQKHNELSAKAKAKGWTTGKKLTDPKTGNKVIPDIITPSGHPLEYKPRTPSGIKKGQSQLKGQERATGTNGRVIFYDPQK
jgi:RHS repeat-associated protein